MPQHILLLISNLIWNTLLLSVYAREEAALYRYNIGYIYRIRENGMKGIRRTCYSLLSTYYEAVAIVELRRQAIASVRYIRKCNARLLSLFFYIRNQINT